MAHRGSWIAFPLAACPPRHMPPSCHCTLALPTNWPVVHFGLVRMDYASLHQLQRCSWLELLRTHPVVTVETFQSLESSLGFILGVSP